MNKSFILIQYFILYFFSIYFSFIKPKNKYFMVIGVDEVANVIHFFKKLFGHTIATINMTPHSFYSTNHYDYSLVANPTIHKYLRLIYGPYLLAKLANETDIFMYIWWTGFCIDREMDYKFLRKKKKKIVCMFVGSDIRSYLLRMAYNEKLNLDTSANYLPSNNPSHEIRVKKVAELADQYADLIFNHPKDQISYLKSKQIISPYMIPDDYLQYDKSKFKNISKIVSVHAPSRPIAKGTPMVRAAIKKLQIEGYDFTYVEFIDRSNKEVLKILEQSHIVLNEFYAFVPGVLSIEGMAKYNAVLTSADFDDVVGSSQNAWFPTKYWEIYDNVKYLLDNKEQIEIYARNGFNFVKNNCTQDNVRNFYIEIFYKNGIISDKNIF